jgi:UDP:flavonoid glycosyltransferase YjiC (YdhE family)
LVESTARILFVPVSGPYGMGEYARSAAIARAVLARWPRAAVHFVLSARAPYAGGSPFAKTLLDSSPTFHSREVIDLMRRWRPNVAVFDNAGRTSQLRAARAFGARIVYISARARQRRKAFRLRWMRLIDEHWIAYPRFIAGELTAIERLKLKLLRRPAMRYLDVILSPAGEQHGAGRDYVLVIPGGGTGHPGAADATQRFADAAKRLAAEGIETRFVGPTEPMAAGEPGAANFRALGVLPQSELAALMRGARLIVTNGGSTLLQAIASGAACVAAAIAGDQRNRIRRCAELNAALEARLAAEDIAGKASFLLRDEAARASLARSAAALGLEDGIEVALRGLAALIEGAS